MKVSIIALGWLGQALYHHYNTEDNEVWGTYCHEKKDKITNQLKYDFSQDEIPKALQDSDILIFNLPPTSIQSLDLFHKFLYQIRTKHLVFISSTSVYGPQGKVTEKTEPKPESPSGNFLLSCERLLRQTHPGASIIRPSGLYGQDRHPGKYLAGKKSKSPGNQRLNLIGQKDLIKIIDHAISNKIPLLNASNQHHPYKKEYYTDYCKKNGLELPLFEESARPEDKIINTIYNEININSPLP